MFKEERFSPAGYAARLKLAIPESESEASSAAEWELDGSMGERVAARSSLQQERRQLAAGDQGGLRQLAEEMRAFVASPRGVTEEERQRCGERLNRAVLGYPRERAELMAIIADRLLRRRIHRPPAEYAPYASLAEALFAEVVGLNVLELLLQNKEELEEIQVVGTRIYEVRGGKAVLSPHRFASERDVLRIQQNLVLYNQERITPRKRWAEVSLADGARVTMTGFGFTSEPTLTIRFYTVHSLSLAELCRPEYRTLNERVRRLLLAVLQSRYNLVIIGPTNSGKTHLMKALLAELPDEERLITIEGRFEMKLTDTFPGKNIIEYEAVEEDELHNGAQAFKLALRQSPERIVHAEIRDEDANGYVRACTRGHNGSMTTVHASCLEDVPDTIVDMCMQDGRRVSPERLRRRVVTLVAQVGIEMRMIGGKRRAVRIGRFRWQDGEAVIDDWAVYDEGMDDWRIGSGAPG